MNVSTDGSKLCCFLAFIWFSIYVADLDPGTTIGLCTGSIADPDLTMGLCKGSVADLDPDPAIGLCKGSVADLDPDPSTGLLRKLSSESLRKGRFFF